MRERVGKILEKNMVDFYICGHIHNFQHIKPEGSMVNYVVNSLASKSRPVKEMEGTVFCNPDPGYSVFSVSADSVRFCFVNHTGEKVYRNGLCCKHVKTQKWVKWLDAKGRAGRCGWDAQFSIAHWKKYDFWFKLLPFWCNKCNCRKYQQPDTTIHHDKSGAQGQRVLLFQPILPPIFSLTI